MKSIVKSSLLFGGALFDTAFAIGVRGFNSSSTHTSVSSTATSKSSTITSMSSSLSSITAAANASICSSNNGVGLYSGYSTDPSLQCYCASQFMAWWTTFNPPTRTLTRPQEEGATTETITSAGSTITTVVEYVTTEYFTRTGNFGGADGFDYYGTADPPCCSSCTIAAQTVNLFYWPTPAVPSQATAFVNSDGYTFVSPSVYMGFTSLSALDLCGNVGNVYTSTTFAFGPSELSTIGSPLVSIVTSTEIDIDNNGNTVGDQTLTETISSPGPASALNYRDLGQNCSTISGYEYLAGNPQAAGIVTYDPCHPTIVLPPQVKSADPAWASCVDNLIGGFYDPPYALTSQGGLQPFAPSTTSASPAQTPQSDQAPSTTTMQLQPTTKPPPPADSSSTPDPQPLATSNPAPPVEPSSTPQSAPADPSNTPAPAASSNPASGDPATPSPASVQPENTPTQNPSASSRSTSLQIPPIVGSQTLTPGGPPVTVSGTVLSLEPSGSSVVINGGSTVPLSEVVSPSQTPVVVGSQTLAPGGPAITVSGTVLSLEPSGSSVVVNGGSTVPLTTIIPSETLVAIGSQTILPGGSPITVSGAVFSLEPSGGGVVVNGASTIPAASLEAEISSIVSAPAVLGTQSLIPGGAPVTLDGTTYSLQPTGGNVIVNGVSTIPLSNADAVISSAVDGKVASAIASVMGVSPTGTTVIGGSTFVLEGSSTVPIASATGTSALQQFTGSGSRTAIKMEAISIALLWIFAGVMLLM